MVHWLFLGFKTLSQELGESNTRLLDKLQVNVDLGVQTVLEDWKEGNARLQATFQNMFPNTWSDEKVDDVMALTEAYHKYKKEYVKHLSFDREEGNLSKYLFVDVH